MADSLMQCPNWVLMWVRRFEEGGIDALRDLSKSGRPPKIDGATMDNMLSGGGTGKDHSHRAPAKNMVGDGDPAPHNVCQEAEVQGRILRQDGRHGTRRPRRQRGGKLLALPDKDDLRRRVAVKRRIRVGFGKGHARRKIPDQAQDRVRVTVRRGGCMIPTAVGGVGSDRIRRPVKGCNFGV